jgi:2-keto-4-pentenoate hydratase/2-oxohepta-3-ene-1,7-dioic acid hydratase in catechol pathway
MAQDRRQVLGLGLGAGAAVAASAATIARAAATGGRLAKTAVTTIVTVAGPGLGVRTPKGVLDVAGAERDLKLGIPTSVIQLVRGEGNVAALERLVANPPARRLIPEAQVRFGNIIDNPPKIICVGLNYAAHAAEGGAAPPKEPILFNKYSTAMNHHGGTIRVTGEPAREWDYEAELVAVMGKGGRHIPEDRALESVFGYAAGNDFTARDLQRRSAQWMLGKTVDGSGPFGPWLVTADQVDVTNLEMKLILNGGEVRQSTNTRLMIFNVAQIIAYCSKHFSLEPGDVIFTGTCEGTIAGYPPDKRVWLKAGDRMVTSISGVGELSVTLV